MHTIDQFRNVRFFVLAKEHSHFRGVFPNYHDLTIEKNEERAGENQNCDREAMNQVPQAARLRVWDGRRGIGWKTCVHFTSGTERSFRFGDGDRDFGEPG